MPTWHGRNKDTKAQQQNELASYASSAILHNLEHEKVLSLDGFAAC